MGNQETCSHCQEIVTARYTLGNVYCSQCQKWIRSGPNLEQLREAADRGAAKYGKPDLSGSGKR